MKVRHFAHGRKHDVWLMCDENDGCQVLDTMMEISLEHVDLVLPVMALLREVVPHEGPPFEDPNRAKMVYNDIIFEVKSDKMIRRKHLGLRVLFFFHEDDNIVVCTNGFLKSGNTPQEFLDFSLSERARFHEGLDDLEFVTTKERDR